MKIIVQYYGVFRTFGSNVVVDIESPATAHAVKNALAVYLGRQHDALIGDSVLANDTDILPDDFVIEQECALSILPPVCGG